MNASTEQIVVGIDVAKDSLEVRTDKSSFSLENSLRGFKALLAGLNFIHDEDDPHGALFNEWGDFRIV